MTPGPVHGPRAQRGVALAVVLILLLVMMLLGLASLRGTLMEERMSANQLDRSLSFQAAEAALRKGEEVAAGLSASALPGAGRRREWLRQWLVREARSSQHHAGLAGSPSMGRRSVAHG